MPTVIETVASVLHAEQLREPLDLAGDLWVDLQVQTPVKWYQLNLPDLINPHAIFQTSDV